jgi:hypothetical protein
LVRKSCVNVRPWQNVISLVKVLSLTSILTVQSIRPRQFCSNASMTTAFYKFAFRLLSGLQHSTHTAFKEPSEVQSTCRGAYLWRCAR